MLETAKSSQMFRLLLNRGNQLESHLSKVRRPQLDLISLPLTNPWSPYVTMQVRGKASAECEITEILLNIGHESKHSPATILPS